MNFHEFYMGKIFDAYKYMGAHLTEDGAVFRTFAPGAVKIALISDINEWQEIPMERVAQDGSFWECQVEGAKAGMMYKYRIYDRSGRCVDHCDPYGFGMELRPNSASILRDMEFEFTDDAWVAGRDTFLDKPLNIYEVHFGSFRKPEDRADAWYNYEEMEDILLPYLKENGYNFLEIMPLNEYPSDESWGYQGTGFFSPTSRYGSAGQLKKFVNACHANGIGVIMDFVAVHFAVDAYGLANYDGTPLYEYPNEAVGDSEWGSKNFMHSRGEVRSFLQSVANYWIEEFHFDGLRMDAISRAIYWQGDPNRGVNGNAVDFLKTMNRGLKERHPNVILTAEDSTSFPGVTKPVEQGGLGFDYKWDMGWMNDTLNYFRTDPQYRSQEYHKLTFSMMYYYDEQYLLPLSHDEVVHGKATILQKMSGDVPVKFPQARAFYMYMYAHPGKKLNFMGNELGQIREWDEKRQQDWHLLEDPEHRAFHDFMQGLNRFYLAHPAFYECDEEKEGFEWLDCHQEEKCIYAMLRSCPTEKVAAIFNFSDQEWNAYQLEIPGAGNLKLVYASDAESGKVQHAEGDVFLFDLKPYSALYYIVE